MGVRGIARRFENKYILMLRINSTKKYFLIIKDRTDEYLKSNLKFFKSLCDTRLSLTENTPLYVENVTTEITTFIIHK